MAMTQEQHTSSQSSETDSTEGIELTAKSIELLDRLAAETGLSKSTLLENIARGELAIASIKAEKTLVLEPNLADDPSSLATISLVSSQESPEQQEITRLEKKYNSLKETYEQQSGLISDLAEKLKEKDIAASSPENESQKVAELEAKYTQQVQRYNDLEQKSLAKDKRITRLQEQLKEQQLEGNRSPQQSSFVERLKKNLEKQIEKIQEQNAQIEKLERELSQIPTQDGNERSEQELALEKNKNQRLLKQVKTKDANIQELQKKLIERGQIEDRLRIEAKDKDLKIAKLAKALNDENEKYQGILTEQSQVIDATIKEVEKRAREHKERDRKLQQQIQVKEQRIQDLEVVLKRYQTIHEESQSLDTEIRELEKQLKEQVNKYRSLEEESQEQETRINELELELDLREEDNTDLQQRLDAQEFTAGERNEAYQSLVDELGSKNQIIQDLQQQIQAATELSSLEGNSEYESLQQESLNKDVQIIKLQEELEQQQSKKKLQTILIAVTSISLLALVGTVSFGYYYYLNH